MDSSGLFICELLFNIFLISLLFFTGIPMVEAWTDGAVDSLHTDLPETEISLGTTGRPCGQLSQGEQTGIITKTEIGYNWPAMWAAYTGIILLYYHTYCYECSKNPGF